MKRFVERIFMDQRGLTLMELMVAIVVVGLMAAFAIPSYNKAVNKSEERQMIVNLRSIISAQEIYKAKNGDYWPAAVFSIPTGNKGLSDLNPALRLSVVNDSKYDYQCNSTANQEFQCYASYSPGGTLAWMLYTNSTIAHGSTFPQQVCCAAGNPCPSLPSCGP